jgi:hypothetical protein
MDLASIELVPEKLARGCHWKVWRAANGAIEGRVVPGPVDGPWLLIVPAGIALERALDEERRPFLDRLRAGKQLEDAEARELAGRAHGRATLKGWGGLTANGAEMPFSESKAIELMTDERWKALRDFVLLASGHQAAAARQEEEQAAGN